jgi:hypothetical protein
VNDFIESSGYEVAVKLEQIYNMYILIAPDLYVCKYNSAYTSPNDMI